METKKIFVLIPAYNTESTIEKVFSRIPRDFLPKISEFLVVNDGSTAMIRLIFLRGQGF